MLHGRSWGALCGSRRGSAASLVVPTPPACLPHPCPPWVTPLQPPPAKRLAVIDDSDEEEDEEASGGRRRGRSRSGSLSAEEEGSEAEESGMPSDLSGDDSHDVDGGCSLGQAGSGFW